MKIMLIGGGTGGHITPLLAVAHEIKKADPKSTVIGVCEEGSRFAGLYKDDASIDRVYQIPAGKFRRYAGESFAKKATDIETITLNFKDFFRTIKGYKQAVKLLKAQKPDVLLVKGGFVAVPLGLAAAKLKIPYVTHDSDSTPGLANRIISRWAAFNATGMPAELYGYPADKVKFTGIPLSGKFTRVTEKDRTKFRRELGLAECELVVSVVGGSLGGDQLNKDAASISDRLMKAHKGLGIVHIAGNGKVHDTQDIYNKKLSKVELDRVVVSGFVDDVYRRQGAADVVITRAGATMTAELANQALPIVIVPASLAGGHQHKNADLFVTKNAAVAAESAEDIFKQVSKLLGNKALREKLAKNLYSLAKPEAAKELALLTLSAAGKAR